MFKFIYAAIVLVIIGLIVYLHLIPAERTEALLQEHGIVEMLSALAWALAAMVLVGDGLKRRSRLSLYGSVVLLFATLRELDFQKHFTSSSVFRLTYYFRNEAPLLERALAAIFVIAVLAITIRFVVLAARPFRRQLKDRHPPALALGVLIILLPCTKLLDRIPDLARKAGAPFGVSTKASISICEEVMEMGVAVGALCAVCHVLSTRPPSQPGSGA